MIGIAANFLYDKAKGYMDGRNSGGVKITTLNQWANVLMKDPDYISKLEIAATQLKAKNKPFPTSNFKLNTRAMLLQSASLLNIGTGDLLKAQNTLTAHAMSVYDGSIDLNTTDSMNSNSLKEGSSLEESTSATRLDTRVPAPGTGNTLNENPFGNMGNSGGSMVAMGIGAFILAKVFKIF